MDWVERFIFFESEESTLQEIRKNYIGQKDGELVDAQDLAFLGSLKRSVSLQYVVDQ